MTQSSSFSFYSSNPYIAIPLVLSLGITIIFLGYKLYQYYHASRHTSSKANFVEEDGEFDADFVPSSAALGMIVTPFIPDVGDPVFNGDIVQYDRSFTFPPISSVYGQLTNLMKITTYILHPLNTSQREVKVIVADVQNQLAAINQYSTIQPIYIMCANRGQPPSDPIVAALYNDMAQLMFYISDPAVHALIARFNRLSIAVGCGSMF